MISRFINTNCVDLSYSEARVFPIRATLNPYAARDFPLGDNSAKPQFDQNLPISLHLTPPNGKNSLRVDEARNLGEPGR